MRQTTMLVALAAVLMVGPSAHAYDMGRGATDDPSKDASQLTKSLNLTDDQRAKVRQVAESFRTRKQQAMEQFHQQMASIQQEEDSQIKALLTAEQQPQFDKLVQERQQRRQERYEEHKEKWSEKHSKKESGESL